MNNEENISDGKTISLKWEKFKTCKIVIKLYNKIFKCKWLPNLNFDIYEKMIINYYKWL